jgi:NADPH:quinone reductase-like Zn-dependent oxidoreductase
MHTPTADLLARVAQYLSAGTITVPIQHTYELAGATDAMQAFSSGHTVGKIAVRIA